MSDNRAVRVERKDAVTTVIIDRPQVRNAIDRPTADALVRNVSADAIRALNPRVTVETVAGPHLLLQARPADAWRAVDEFLTRNGIAPSKPH